MRLYYQRCILISLGVLFSSWVFANGELVHHIEEVETPSKVQAGVEWVNAVLESKADFAQYVDLKKLSRQDEYSEDDFGSSRDSSRDASNSFSDDSPLEDDIFDDVEVDEKLLSKIVNLAKVAWKVVVKNKPLLNVEYSYANALPALVESPYELAGFSPMQHKSYRIYAENIYGAKVYDLTYTLVHRFGGSYENRGSFLSAVSIVPSEISVLWGFKVNIDVNQVSLANIGTTENPVASLGLQVTAHVKTILKESVHRQIFEFKGDDPEVVSMNF